jgi:PAS domain S-box-containing protein
MTATRNSGGGRPHEPIHVLLVDDDAGSADATTTRLRAADDRFAVRTALDPGAALDRLAAHDVDCVVADHDGPEVDDVALVEAVREPHPDVPVVVFTANGSERVASEAFTAGATDYVRKDADGHAALAGRVAAAVEEARADRERARRARAMTAAEEGIAIVDGDGHYEAVNDAYAALHGVPAAAMVGERWSATVTERAAERLRSEAVPALEEAGAWSGETVGERADGTTYAKRLSLSALGDGGHVCVVRDVSDRRERERELERARDRVELALERTDSIVFEIDLDSGEVTRHGEFEQFFDLPPEAVPDWEDHLERAVHPDDRAAFRRFHRELVAGERDDGVMEYRTAPEFGDVRWIRDEVHVERDDGTRRAVGVAKDVTERVDRECKLTALHDVAVELETDASVESICERTVEASNDVLAFDLSNVGIEDDGVFEGVATSGSIDSGGIDGMAADERIAGRTYRTGESMIVEDVESHPDADPQGPFRSGISVPLGDHGVFQAVAETTDAFDEDDLELAELLTTYATQALDRVERERELGRERDRMDAIVEAIPEPVSHVRFEDGDPLVEAVNPAFEETFGCDERAIAGRSLNDVIVPDDRRADARTIDEGTESDDVIEEEVERRAADGRRQFLFRGQMLDGAAGTREGLGIYVDITDRKSRERHLEQNQRRFEAIFEDPNILVGLLDTDGTLLDANRTSMEYVDADVADVVGVPYPEAPWWDDESRPAVRRLVERAAAGEYGQYEADLTRPDGEPYAISGDIRPVTDDDGEVVSMVVSARDISEQRRRERQLEAMDRVLRHNLSNEMAVVLGSAETIAAMADGEAAAYAEDILDSGRHLLDVTSKQRHIVDILSDPPDVTTVDVSRSVRDSVEGVVRTHPDADVAVAAPEGVQASAVTQLDRAVSELVENAVVHADDPTPRVEVGVEATADCVRVRVADHGPPIPAAERAILLGEGREDPLYHGSGMGLWLVDRVVESCGGRVVHRENDPRGNVVVVELPAAPDGPRTPGGP